MELLRQLIARWILFREHWCVKHRCVKQRMMYAIPFFDTWWECSFCLEEDNCLLENIERKRRVHAQTVFFGHSMS